MKKLTLTVLGLCAALWAEAGGFQVVLQGVRQTGMGNTGSALADVSNAFYNPGAIGFIEGGAVSAGVNGIFATTQFTPMMGDKVYTTENPISTPFYLHAAFGFGKDKAIKAGISVVTPYGSSVAWEKNWSGETYLDKIALSSVYIQPTLAYRINKYVSVGAGFQYVLGKVNLQRKLALPTNGAFADSELDGKAKGFGWNVGVVVKPVDKLQIGLAYRAKVDAKVEDGTATFSNIPMLADPNIPGTPGQQLAATFPNLSNGTSTTKFNVTLPLPAVATLGISWLPSENLTINAEARYTFWSAYEELRFDFKEAVAGSTVSASPRNYADRVTYGLGAEYKIKDLAIRAGGYYDPTPIRNGYMTAETPDADTFAGTLGFGYTINKKISIDFGSIFLSKEKRSNNIPESNTEADSVGPSGTYKTNSFVGTLGVSFIF